MSIQTKEKLLQLKLSVFVSVLNEIEKNDSHQLSINEALGMMVEREVLQRENKRLDRLLKAAKLRYPNACVAGIDYGTQRKFNKEQLRQLAQLDIKPARWGTRLNMPALILSLSNFDSLMRMVVTANYLIILPSSRY